MDEETAREIKRRHSARLMNIEGVQGVGIGPGPVLQIYLDRDSADLAEPLPEVLEGLTVQVLRTDPFKPQ